MTFPRYPEYKNSGVEWIGQVPVHWGVERLKVSVKTCRNGIWGNEPNGNEDDIPCVRVADFDRTQLEVQHEVPTIRNVTEKEQLNRTLSKGNLLIEKSGGGDNQPVGCVVLYNSTHKAVCSNFVAKIELAPKMDPSFWRYVHSAAYSIRLTIGSINQTSGIQNLDQDRYFNERSAYPPLNEQILIAKFLEIETAKIDLLVTEQGKLIELLKEKRQAVISHSVTKGLNPNVNKKESGNSWLNEVPTNWIVGRLKHIKSKEKNSFVDGPFGSNLKSEHFIEGGDVYVIESNFATQGLLELENLKTISFKHFETIDRSEVRSGDIVIAKIGAQYGKSSILPNIDKRAVVSGNSLKLTVNQAVVDVNFVNWFLVNLKSLGVIEDIVNATAQPALSLGELNNLPMLIPPLKEQQLIVEYLEVALNKFQSLIDEANTNINLLKERRSALITASVTGQIDVRNYHPRAPNDS
jgi:type I restriction enzyme S subunit